MIPQNDSIEWFHRMGTTLATPQVVFWTYCKPLSCQGKYIYRLSSHLLLYQRSLRLWTATLSLWIVDSQWVRNHQGRCWYLQGWDVAVWKTNHRYTKKITLFSAKGFDKNDCVIFVTWSHEHMRAFRTVLNCFSRTFKSQFCPARGSKVNFTF